MEATASLLKFSQPNPLRFDPFMPPRSTPSLSSYFKDIQRYSKIFKPKKSAPLPLCDVGGSTHREVHECSLEPARGTPPPGWARAFAEAHTPSAADLSSSSGPPQSLSASWSTGQKEYAALNCALPSPSRSQRITPRRTPSAHPAKFAHLGLVPDSVLT